MCISKHTLTVYYVSLGAVILRISVKPMNGYPTDCLQRAIGSFNSSVAALKCDSEAEFPEARSCLILILAELPLSWAPLAFRNFVYWAADFTSLGVVAGALR
ncbi:hypothetical protein BKA63DRAFT_294325 [Paraphoma chrysanthemicola]|nr:hypothetical protein BKA63DRAFT_294325 [Paraphoma chrysanthemicola]